MRYSVYKYHDIKIFGKLSFQSKYSCLGKFYYDLDKFSRLKTHIGNRHTKTDVYDKASEFYNELLGIYFDEYYD